MVTFLVIFLMVVADRGFDWTNLAMGLHVWYVYRVAQKKRLELCVLI